MKIYETLKRNRVLILAGAIALVWFMFGFFVAKHHYNKPFKEKVETDTIIVHDTIPDYNPTPKDSATIKYVTRYLPVLKTDTVMGNTITNWEYIQTHDTVAVEVPITSKHYKTERYDAYISGFEPNLDSIFVYQETQYITETITRMKPPNKLELDIVGGIDYGITSKQWQPFAGGELILNNHKRLKFGIGGGVKREPIKREWQPYVEGNIRLKVF